MREQDETDEELAERARTAPGGDRRAFETLVIRHQDRILANCRYISRSPNDSEDLAQEVFLKAYFALSRFEGRSTVKTWLQRIKVNHCLNHIKKKAGKTFVDVDSAEGTESEAMSVEPKAAKNVETMDQRERIGHVLDQLTDTLRLPLIMRDMDHLSYQEISDTLGVRLSAVKMRIKRARGEFRRLYSEPSETTDTAKEPMNDESIDTGEPIAEISDFAEPARSGFLHRLRNKIERRVLTAEITALAWETPKAILLELLEMVFSMFRTTDDDKKEDRG